VVIEKPFGHDLASARALNDAVHRELGEHQVLRIDHYLGKETVQNLLGLRFHNAIFEPVWNRHHVELVQITVAETAGVEQGRADYYDGTGAMRDVVQNHMLQVLALVAMEPPASLDADVIRNQKVDVLKALRAVDREDAALHSVRARYGPGTIGAAQVAGYLDEEGVAPGSTTETYVALRAEVDNWRWRGVPFCCAMASACRGASPRYGCSSACPRCSCSTSRRHVFRRVPRRCATARSARSGRTCSRSASSPRRRSACRSASSGRGRRW